MAFFFCASCFRLRMNVVWDALPRCVPRCRAAVLSRAFRAFRAAFRAAALSALLSALSVSRFVAWALSALLSALSVSRFVAWALSALPRFPRCFPRCGRDGMQEEDGEEDEERTRTGWDGIGRRG